MITEGRLPHFRNVGVTNVSDLERYASMAVGGALLVNGLRKRSVLSLGFGLIAGGHLIWRGATGHCSLYQALDVNTANGTDGVNVPSEAPEIVTSITIGRSAEQLYELWRNPESLALIMEHFAEVTAVDGPRLTHWKVKSPVGKSIEWDAELTVERPGEQLSWASKPGALLANEGTVYFKPAPAEWGTEVRVRFRFQPPLGKAGDWLATTFAMVPRKIAEASLRHLKNLAETGEIPTLAQNSSARGSSDLV